MESKENPKYVEIGRRIKNAREKEGLKQAELARLLKYSSPTFISLIEDGKRKVRIDDLEKISDILHRNVNFFITGKDSNPQTVQMALRADDDLDHSDVKKVETVIEMLKLMKKKQNDGRSQHTP